MFQTTTAQTYQQNPLQQQPIMAQQQQPGQILVMQTGHPLGTTMPQHQPTNFSNSLMSLCCGGCRKNPSGYNHPQTQLLNPSISNNFLYQQHFQHLQQPKQIQQQQPQQQQQQQQFQQRIQQQQSVNSSHNNQLTAATPTVITAPTSSLVPGGGQQRYVGNLSYVMQQQHPIYHQLAAQNAATMSPSRSAYTTNQQQPGSGGIYTKQPLYSTSPYNQTNGRVVSDMIIQPDSFRRISGLTTEVFRQIELVEAQFDPSTLAAQYAEMERRGEMIIRILSPTQLLPQWLDETARRYGDGCTLPSWIQFVEIIKRPGQTLGLYIREGDGIYTMDGVYISRIALESPVYQSGCLRVGDEILAINFVDVSGMSLDDVVLLMSIPRRLILTIRSRPLNAEHMLTNRNIYGTGMSDSYYDTVATDIYSRVDDVRKPVVVVKQQLSAQQEPLLDEEEEEDVLAAASAAAEAGLLDDPSTAAAAAVAALQDPTPAKAAAAVAAVNEMVRSGSMMDIYDDGRRSASLMKLSPRRRRMYTSDNLADLYQNDDYGRLGTINTTQHASSSSSATNKAQTRGPLSSLYHGRLSHTSHGSRSRSATGRLMRTSSEQMLYPMDHSGQRLNDPAVQIDHFLQRYQTLKQIQHQNRRRRHHSFDQTTPAMVRNSFSSQSLLHGTGHAGSSAYNYPQHGMAIPLPGMAEAAVAIARRRYLRGETSADNGSYSDTETPGHHQRDRSSYRSNSLPRSGLYPPSTHHHSRAQAASGGHRGQSNLSNRLQQLEQFYSNKKPLTSASARSQLSTGYRPHSALGGYSSGEESEALTRMRRNLGHRYSQPGLPTIGGNTPAAVSSLLTSTRLDALRMLESDLDPKRYSSSSPITNISNDHRIGSSTSAIYETIRKSKMAQDVTQPQSGRLMPTLATAANISSTDDMKSRFSSLQRMQQQRLGSGTGLMDDHHHHQRSRHITEQTEMIGHDQKLTQPQQQHHHHHQRQQRDRTAKTSISPTNAQAATASSLIGQISTRPSKTLMIDPSGFQQYCPELYRGQSTTDGQVAGYSGLLVIHLLGVRGLQLDSGGQSSKTAPGSSSTNQQPMMASGSSKRVLYSVVECDRIYKARTVAVQSHENNPTNFDWDEVFDIDLFDTKEVSFLFYTWDQSLPDLNMRHKQCSKGTIHLPCIPALTTQHVHAFELRLYETPGAMFYIKLEYHDLQTTFKRTKRDPKSSRRSSRSTGGSATTSDGLNNNYPPVEQPLFGVDLETVINREGSGFSIPIIIKRCCEEIEQRGLHMLGIYRLCGSSLVKRNLRESFERNAWLADISADNVPDINVLTSLLKDYLRELPEPLFNKAMFDMMDDGLSVCVPDDPSGNAKLMFSILECLPKSHRDTVLYLMDHIKLVHSNSDRNKMTSQALAICFGPLFSCHSQSESVYKPIQVFKFLLDIWPQRKGAFNMLKKFEDMKTTDIGATVTATTAAVAFGTSTTSAAALTYDPRTTSGYSSSTSTANQYTGQYGRIGYTAKSGGGGGGVDGESHLYDSPPSSPYRFQTTTSSNLMTSTTSTTTASMISDSELFQRNYSKTTTTGGASSSILSQTTTTWSSIGSGGSGRMLPSTQNATRTISAYSSTTNSVSKYKVPAGSTGPSVMGMTPLSSAAINRGTDSGFGYSGSYRSRFGTTSSSSSSTITTTTTTTTTTTGSTTTTTSSYDVLPTRTSPSRFSTDYGSDFSTSRSPYYHHQPSSYGASEVIDQTYLKYLTPSSGSGVGSGSESLYSTVNKSGSSTTTATGIKSAARSTVFDGCGSLSFLDDDTTETFLSSASKTRPSSSSYLNMDDPLANQSGSIVDQQQLKPLISGGIGPTSTQLYPSRLASSAGSTTTTTAINHSVITSSYTTGYSSTPYSSSMDYGTNAGGGSYGGGSIINKSSTSSSSYRNHDFDHHDTSTKKYSSSILNDGFATTTTSGSSSNTGAETTLAHFGGNFKDSSATVSHHLYSNTSNDNNNKIKENEASNFHLDDDNVL